MHLVNKRLKSIELMIEENNGIRKHMKLLNDKREEGIKSDWS